MSGRRIAGLALLAMAGALIAYAAAGWPDLSTPPASWNAFATNYTRRVLPILYWFGAVALLTSYAILLWQRNPDETHAARWNRRLALAFGLLLLTLATGRSVLQDWLVVGFAVGVTLVIAASFALGIAFVASYAYPVWMCRGGRCEVVPEVPPVLPVVPKVEVWDGVKERRVGVKDRRRIQA